LENRRRVRRLASGRSNYNYFRDYDPATGRYAQSDPIGIRGGINTYAYTGDSPLLLSDPFGTKPGDSFVSAEAAAIDALSYVSSLSDCSKYEYAGWIYKEWSLFGAATYSYDEPKKLGAHGGVMPPRPIFHSEQAMFHNHPPYPDYDYDNFSYEDRFSSQFAGLPSYLGTPGGSVKRYTPSSVAVDVVSTGTCRCER